MPRLIYILFFLFLALLLPSCISFSKSGPDIYRGGRASLTPSHHVAFGARKKYARILKRQRKSFGASPRGMKYNGAFASSLKEERRKFGSGMTRGRSNALPSDRHNQGLGSRKKFQFMFPGHRKFYRGHRSKLGLFKMK